MHLGMLRTINVVDLLKDLISSDIPTLDYIIGLPRLLLLLVQLFITVEVEIVEMFMRILENPDVTLMVYLPVIPRWYGGTPHCARF